jgi:phosphotransferase system enzyme I (PtsI)
MDIKRGIAVSPGVAIGPALVLDTEGVVVPPRTVPPAQVDHEVARLSDALRLAAEEAEQRRRDVAARLPGGIAEDIGNIFGGHALFAQDHVLRGQVETLIRAQQFSAEYAVSRALGALVRQLGEGGGAVRPPVGRLAGRGKATRPYPDRGRQPG